MAEVEKIRPEQPQKRRTLYEQTRLLLIHRDRTLSFPRISRDTGLAEAWLYSLTSKKPPNAPDVTKIQKLYEYLSGKKLDY